MHATRLHRWATAGLWLLGLVTLALSCALAWLVSSSLSVAQETTTQTEVPSTPSTAVIETGF